VPGQEGLRCDESGEFVQHPAAQLLSLDCQTTALVIVQAQPSIAELFPKHSVFFLEVVDDVFLVLVQPAREGNEQQPKGIKSRTHWAILAPEALPKDPPDQARGALANYSAFRRFGFSDRTRLRRYGRPKARH
jgi:hypothetical protein